VTSRKLGRLIGELNLPEEQQAQERTWQTVRAAFSSRERTSHHRRLVRPALALAVLAALTAAVLSPRGEAVLEAMRKAIGIERSQPALFSLPAPGRLLVDSTAGSWVVSHDGSKRLLGRYREASWSPFGRFVVAAGNDELAALEPNGTVRWKLARPAVRFPRWGGTRTDTRIAYLSGSRLHVVAGDGTGDVDAGGLPAAAPVAPAWQAGTANVLAYVTTRGRVYVYASGAGSLRWHSAPFPHPRQLAWSADGTRLLLVTRDKLILFRANRAKPLRIQPIRGVVEAAFAPNSHQLAVARARDVLLLDGARGHRVFAGAGQFSGVTWSPDGDWLLVAWRDADQWVFVHATGRHRLQAVSNISRQFDGGFPRLDGWCCANANGS
jgi:hypothetical protein